MGASSPIPFGRYTLIERLAVGGMAELFLGTAPGEHGFQRQVVIKRLLPNLAREPVYTAMFIDEAKLTAKLSHPKIAQTYELGRVGTELFIAMEFVDGLDVLAMLRELAWQRRRMPTELAVWVTHEVLDALDFAHNLKDEQGNSLGIVHRDISPSNVLLSRRGDVKLVDFGIARAVGPGRHHRTKSGTLKGKYGYMSPEQVIEQPVDARSDLFSAGVVLAEMLCGRRLFAATAEIDVLLMVRDAKLSRLDQYGGHIPGSLDAILRKALSKDPADRHASAADMRDALQDWLFEERRRVTPKQLGELVETLYESAWKRRRESMAQAAAEQASAAVAAEQAVSAGLGADGIPGGELLVGESMPIISIETPANTAVTSTDSADIDLGDLDLGAIASPGIAADDLELPSAGASQPAASAPPSPPRPPA
ncbi:MAG: serine/threonine protein kinase, partial [Deltaproteobacteria bacterium]|nr:serine/threonine protein kinase [Kofleriaceae bacterium]